MTLGRRIAFLAAPLMVLATAGWMSMSGSSGLPVTILSQSGPLYEGMAPGEPSSYHSMDVPVAATSLGALRSTYGCAGADSVCWPGVHVGSDSDLLVTAITTSCRSLTSLTAKLDGHHTLVIAVNFATGVNTGCMAAIPPISLLGIPLSSLPHHVHLTVETTDGRTTVYLP